MASDRDFLPDNWQEFADRLADWAEQTGIYDEDEAQDIGEEFAEQFADLYERYDAGEIDRAELDYEWYELYDTMYDDLGLEDFFEEGYAKD